MWSQVMNTNFRTPIQANVQCKVVPVQPPVTAPPAVSCSLLEQNVKIDVNKKSWSSCHYLRRARGPL